MDSFNRHDHLEIIDLKLTPEQFPFPCSLYDMVVDLYAGSADAEHTMEFEELIQYLKTIDTFELGPMEAVLAQTEAIGDPALPSPTQKAILIWLNVAYTHWESEYPIEQPLASEFRKLLPLAAALALSDPDFLIPGGHGFHTLLDTLQASVIGWQPRIGRASHALERDLGKAISESRNWFNEESVDLDTIYQAVTSATKKDRGRAQRMSQRVAEAEKGQLKTANSKLLAAQMINLSLAKYPAPKEIGHFLKGPWYTSSQLVLLRFGDESTEWEEMSATTETLLDSLQAESTTEEQNKSTENSNSEGGRRQHVFEAITKLPRQLKRWLVSLQHDDDGVSDAIAMIEVAHMKVLRKQDLDLAIIEPLSIESGVSKEASKDVIDRINKLRSGQWFLVKDGRTDPIRVQLILKTEPNHQLIFTDHTGIKALQLSYTKFDTLLNEDKAVALYSGASFSISLAYAAEICTQTDMETLTSAVDKRQEQAKNEAAKAQQVEQEKSEQLHKDYEAAVKIHQEREDAQQCEELAEVQAAFNKREQEDKLREQEKIHLEADEPRSEHHNEPEELLQELVEEQLQPEELILEPVSEEQRIANDQDDAEKARKESYRQQKAVAEQEVRRFITPTRKDQNTNISSPPEPEPEPEPEPLHTDSGIELNLTMGTWLGFHDGDKPLLAKLAVYDRERDNYTFVNREGIKMRRLKRQELVSLMDRGLIDIMETRSNFKDEITRVRNEIAE